MDKRTYHNKVLKKASFIRGFNDHAKRGIEYFKPEDYKTHQCEGNRASQSGISIEQAIKEFEKNWEANT